LAIRQSHVGEADFIPYLRIDEVSNSLGKQRLSQSRRGRNISGVHTGVRQVFLADPGQEEGCIRNDRF